MEFSAFCNFGCPNGWMPYDHDCFRSVVETVTFNQAEANCRSIGGHLATFSSAMQQISMKGLLFDVPDDRQVVLPEVQTIWIGLWISESQWKWMDDSPLTYSYFSSTAATTIGSCGMIVNSLSAKTDRGKWTPADCATNATAYLCETPTIF
ncbi:unnamed protein product [Caenorhabditis auriculariae]|uniref:C-type lectin domain-containing protein n=1 Tax=Caenorhabditis auriculariae TaxID=2777116 RepID=A0A8S1HAH2_9PELO|nr:unnamed protein product [Caenorhabditis auriculariae]